MDEILSAIVAAMVTGASVTAKDLASEALRGPGRRGMERTWVASYLYNPLYTSGPR
jgi:hypothetical protein